MQINRVQASPQRKQNPQGTPNFKNIQVIQTFEPKATLYAADIFNIFARLAAEAFQSKANTSKGLFVFNFSPQLKIIENAFLDILESKGAGYPDNLKHDPVANPNESMDEVIKRLRKSPNPIGFSFKNDAT